MTSLERLLSWALLLGLATTAAKADEHFKAVNIESAAKLVIGNTVVVDPHPKQPYEVSSRYYPSLDRVYECSRMKCGTYDVRIVGNQFCVPNDGHECFQPEGRWFFTARDPATLKKGARIGSFVVIGAGGRPVARAILKGNATGFPDFTVPPAPLQAVTVAAGDAVPGTENIRGQWQGRDLGKLFPGNTLVSTDGTLEACLKGAEYYAPGGRLFSLGCSQKNNNRSGADYAIFRLRWRLRNGKFCTTGRMDPERFVCITDDGQNSALLSKGGPFPPPPGRLAVQFPGGDTAPLLRGNIFHFRN